MRGARRLPHAPALRPHAVHQRRLYRRNAVPPLSSPAADIIFHAERGGTLPAAATSALTDWIAQVITLRHGQLGELTYIFCSDDYLHAINLEYLQHDTLTDIVTFPYAEFPLVCGDLFISTDRVADNATEYGEAYEDELHRVMIHGVLHLLGQADKTEQDAAAMRQAEQWALSLRTTALKGGASAGAV